MRSTMRHRHQESPVFSAKICKQRIQKLKLVSQEPQVCRKLTPQCADGRVLTIFLDTEFSGQFWFLIGAEEAPKEKCYCNLAKSLHEENITGEGFEARSLIPQTICHCMWSTINSRMFPTLLPLWWMLFKTQVSHELDGPSSKLLLKF